MARAAQEERCGGQVEQRRGPKLALHGLEAGDPEARGLAGLLGLLALVGGQFLVAVGLFPVAVVRLVVQHDDAAVLAREAQQVVGDPLQHLAVVLNRVRGRIAALEQRTTRLADLQRLARLEGVVVGDDDLGAVDVRQHVRRDQFPAFVIAVRVVGLQDAQAVSDGDAGRHHEEASAEQAAAGCADGIDRLPGDQHRHHGRFAAARGHFQGDAEQFGVGLLVGAFQVLAELVVPAVLASDLGQPDGGLDRFHLAEKRAYALELVVAPVGEQALGGGRDTPVGRVRDCPPSRDVAADFVDDGGRVVFLLFGRKVLRVRQDKVALSILALLLARLWDGGDQLRPSAPLDRRHIQRLTLGIQGVVPGWRFIGGVQDRLVEGAGGHQTAASLRLEAA